MIMLNVVGATLRKMRQMVGVIAVLCVMPIYEPVFAMQYENTDIIRDVVPSKEWILPKIYGNTESRYSIKYPKDWTAERNATGMLIVQGKGDTLSYLSTVNIQAINLKKYGGKFSSVKEFMNSIRYQIGKKLPGAKIIGDGSVVLTQLDGKKVVGKYIIFTFISNGIVMQQLQIVVQRFDKDVFYTWAYTSPIVEYSRDLTVAEKMLDTWHIY